MAGAVCFLFGIGIGDLTNSSYNKIAEHNTDCKRGVLYYDTSNGLSPAYDRNGKVITCKEELNGN